MNKLVFVLMLSTYSMMGQYVIPENVYSRIEVMPKIITSDMIFNGNPKEVTSDNYNLDGGTEKYEGYSTWKFNENNQLTEFSFLVTKSIQKTTYLYTNELLMQITEHDVKNNSIYKKTLFSYNENNTIEKRIKVNSEGDTTGMRKYFYSKNDSLYPFKIENFGSISSAKGIEDFHLSSYLLLEYDTDYMITKVREYDPDGEFVFGSQFAFNSGELIQEGITFNEDFKLRTSYIYKRDKSNRIVERLVIDEEKERLDYKNFYQGDFLIKRVYYLKNDITTISAVEEFEYNKIGEVVLSSKENYIRLTKNRTSYTIEYDSNNNPIRKRILNNGESKRLMNYKYIY